MSNLKPKISSQDLASNEQVLLDEVLSQRFGTLSEWADNVAFERFSIEQAIKAFDVDWLDDNEISSGNLGGGGDGGIDGIYVFLDNKLVAEVDELPPADEMREGVTLRLWTLQAKRSRTFSEEPLRKAADTLEKILTLSDEPQSLAPLLSEEMIERVALFRYAWKSLLTKHPRIEINFCYASRGNTASINNRVKLRAEELEKNIRSRVRGDVSVEVKFLGARELYDLYDRRLIRSFPLRVESTIHSDGSYLVLVTLPNYFDFLDNNGRSRDGLYESNVRDFNGKVSVNKAISRSLTDADPNSPNFWWLNNGVTIICARADSAQGNLTLKDPQIVNGLQTSQVIHDYFLKSSESNDHLKSRMILIRVVVTEDPDTFDQVIRATNNQTAVSEASLRATDHFQRDLEFWLLRKGWFYERRKNYYKNRGKPSDRILSLTYITQAMLATAYNRPDTARARPSTIIKDSLDYESIFSDTPFQQFLEAVEIQLEVDAFLKSSQGATSRSEFTNLRFYLSMLLATKSHPGSIAAASAEVPRINSEETKAHLSLLRDCLRDYSTEMSISPDTSAKSKGFVEYVLNKALPTSSYALIVWNSEKKRVPGIL